MKEMTEYKKGSLSLAGAVSLGTGVMIGAGIFALTGEIAALAGNLFMGAFILAGVVTGFTSYTYIKMSNAYPSAGGIGMILTKIYGKGVVAAWGSLLMYFSMIINESLVARTFANYTVQIKGIGLTQNAVPWLALGLIIFAFFINILSNKWIQTFSFFMAVFKVIGLIALAVGGLYASGISLPSVASASMGTSRMNFIGAIAIGVLAFKGFTTITNSGGEIDNPHKNVGRAIAISIVICLVVYILVTLAVGSALPLEQILAARNYSLAAAAKPTYGELGETITVAVAIIATVSGIIASMFAVSRMLTMLTNMNLVPHKHFGMPGDIHKHTLVYTTVFAAVLALTFDVSRIAALGAFFYIAMDILIHYGVLTRFNRDKVNYKPWILKLAIVLDLVILGGLIYVKVKTDMFLIGISIFLALIIYFYESYFLKYTQS
ncbi:MAG: APC family permease [Bdellovibrionales bacterium]|nr:APC family permease [Bdellovibrionales bacterium]